MTDRPTVHGARGALSARRIILLTTISGLAAAALFVGVGIKLDPPSLSPAYAAESAPRPARRNGWEAGIPRASLR